MKKINSTRFWLNLLLMGSLLIGISSCVQKNDIDDDPCFNIINILITDDGGSSELLSDICVLDSTKTYCTFYNDVASISIENLPKLSYFIVNDSLDILFTKYDVYYERRDEGTAVPPPISHRIAWWVKIDQMSQYTFSIVTHEQKMLPPLDDLRELGYDRETGNFTIETDAHVILRGHTRAGCKIVVDTTFPIKFADFADN